MTNVTKQLAVGDRFSMGPLTCEITKVDKFGNTPHYGFSFRIDTTGQAPIQSGWMPCFFVENYTGHSRGANEVREQLSACQLQNETSQAALERSRESDAAQLRATGQMQIERDALIVALRDVLGWYSTSTVGSAMSKLGEQADYQRTLGQARKALWATNVDRGQEDTRPYTGVNAFGNPCPKGSFADISH